MSNESGEWIIHGMDYDAPGCIRSWEELIRYIDQIGFLPLFRNEIPGFSAEEHTPADGWWTGDLSRDPWAWRELIARSGQVAYGKFFQKKAGFISKKWFPYFANYRRNGYDFDSLYEDELASIRCKKIMDLFEKDGELYSSEMKKKAGFGKGGEKNFDGTAADLQMQTYLILRDFRQRVNKKGESYGWPVSVYTTPENLWGYEHVTSAYREEPECSKARILAQMKELFPDADEKLIRKVCG